MDIAIIILALTCIFNLFFGLFVLSKNPRSMIGQSFFAISFFISAWALCNYLTDNASNLSQNILFNKLSYLFGFLAIVAAGVFSYVFTNRKIKYGWYWPLIILIVGVVSFLSLTPYIAGTVSSQNGQLVFTIGGLSAMYVLAFVLVILLIVRNFYKLIRHGDTMQKNQARIITAAFTASILVGIVTNVVIPSIVSSFNSAKFGPPLLSVLLIGSISYAIVKHQLFDIRFLVARSFAYLLTLVFLAIAYIVIAFGVASSFFAGNNLQSGQQAFFVVFTLFAALSFQPVKHLFDKLTNKLFLRDYYEPQEVLDKLSNFLVGSVDAAQIKAESAKIIAGAIRPVSVGYLLLYDQTLQSLEAEGLLNMLIAEKSEIIMTEELGVNKSSLHQTLMRKNVAVAASLRTKTAQLGFLILGYKQSGSIYSEIDKKMLSIAADEIAISLQNALRFEEIRRFNITLQQRVEEATKELQAAGVKLRLQNKKLKELDQTKDEFISMASHQLRTPLTTIKGYLSMVLEGDVGPVTTGEKDMLKKAFDGAQRMVYLIADLLNVSRLQSGKFVIENKPTNLADLIQGEVEQLKETAKNHRLALIYQKPETFPTLMLDDNKIRQVVMNFLDNAIYYTAAGGQITAKVEATEQSVNFTVTDTGMGVPEEIQHHLFAKFYRADNARKMRPDGTGLGLFMAKKVIVAQGGAIIFASTEGKGSTFGFSFPRKTMEVSGLSSKINPLEAKSIS